MQLRITRDDVLKSKTLPSDWFPVEVTDYEEKVSKAGDSMNYTLTFTVLDGEYKGAKLFRLFNEKAPGFAIPFLEAIGVEVAEEGGEFNLEACKGKRLKVFNKPELYEGQLRNRVEGFAAL